MPSIVQRNGRWRAEVVRRPRRWSRTFNTRTAARAWALDLEDFLDRGGDPDRPDKLTVGEWEKVWWKARIVERTTREADRSRLDVHVLTTWKDVPLDRVTPMGVQAWVRQLENKGLAAATVSSCHNLLSGMMSAAVREGHVGLNPCTEVRLPALAPHREVYLTQPEVQRLLEVVDGQDRTIILTLVLTGLRWGELAGLKVSALDLLRRRLEVVRVMTRYGPKEYPKTRDRRTLPIPAVLVDALAAHLVGHDNGLVFHLARGGPLNYSAWRRKVWLAAIVASGISKEPRIHDLRHTYASWLVQAGRSLDEVQKLLGHRSIVTTQRYSHFKPDHGLTAVTALDALDWSGGPQAYAIPAEGL
jgi:integrase